MQDVVARTGGDPDSTVVHAFDRVATSAPERLAVSSWDGALSYGELDAAARALAPLLVLDGGPIAIWAERGRWLPVAVLAAMRSRAVFTVLDPAQPAARNLACLEALGARTLVVSPGLALPGAISTWAKASGALVLSPDTTAAPPASSLSAPAPGDPAYVLFTSGTTGAPKAILTHHAPLAHFLEWQARRFSLGPDDRGSVLSGLAHDPLLRDLFAPLTAGGAVCVPRQELIRDPVGLRRWLRDERVTLCHLTPALGQLLAAGAAGEPPLDALRLVFSGGARLDPRDAAALRGLMPHTSLINAYGTSETPQIMVFHAVAPDEPIADEVPLGRPIDDVELELVDDDGRPVPDGQVGEIVIRTRYLSRGYLGDEALTRARYLRDDVEPDVCRYRTGDLGARDATGAVRYHGRVDDQVKISGHRVELGEVEAAIHACDGVEQVVVLPRGDAGPETLVAYVAGPADERSLRAQLATRLPPYMIPAVFVAVPAMPLSPNGKIDRKALRALAVAPRARREPRTEAERRVVEAWTATLGHAPDLDDDFFTTGGTSLLAVALLARLDRPDQPAHARLRMRTLLEAPTPASLAHMLEHPEQQDHEVVVELRRGGPRAPVFWLPGGGGISVLVFRDISLRLPADRAVYGLETPVEGVTAHRTVEQRAAQFVRHVRRVQPHGPYHLLGFSLGSFVAFEMARQIEAAGEQVGLLVVFDTHCVPRHRRRRVDELAIRVERVGYVARQLASLSLAERSRYVGGLLRQRVDTLREGLQQRSWELLERVGARGRGRQEAEPRVLDVEDIDKGARRRLREYAEAFDPAPIRAPMAIVLALQTSYAGVSEARDPRLGWRRYTTGPVEVHRVPGSHLGMALPENIEALAAVLCDCLDRSPG